MKPLTLTLNLPNATMGPYANNWGPNETPSNSSIAPFASGRSYHKNLLIILYTYMYVYVAKLAYMINTI